MVSKLAVQSRSASLIASLSACRPLSTGTTSAPISCIRKTFSCCRSTSCGAHVDAGLEPEQGAGHRGGDAVLAGAGLGDQPGLAHPPGEQRLAEHLVGLVGAAVEQVLALQIDARLAGAEVAAAGQRRRPAGIIGEQVGELGLEGRDPPARRGRPPRAARAPASGSRAHRRRHKRRTGPHQHDAASPRAGSRSASKKAASRAGSLRPGAASTPEPTSSAIGADPRRGARIAGIEAAGEQGRAELAAAARPAPSRSDAGAAAAAADRRVEQGPVGAEPRLGHRRRRPRPPPRSRRPREAGSEAR